MHTPPELDLIDSSTQVYKRCKLSLHLFLSPLDIFLSLRILRPTTGFKRVLLTITKYTTPPKLIKKRIPAHMKPLFSSYSTATLKLKVKVVKNIAKAISTIQSLFFLFSNDISENLGIKYCTKKKHKIAIGILIKKILFQPNQAVRKYANTPPTRIENPIIEKIDPKTEPLFPLEV